MTLTDISMRFGGQTLYEDVSWQLRPDGHYGLVGANGSGKSTLLKIMTAELAASTGSVGLLGGLRIGTLGQDQFTFDEARLIDVVVMGRAQLWAAMDERSTLLAQVDGHADAKAGERLAELELEVASLGGYQAEAQAAELLVGLGIPHSWHTRPMRELSGGFRLRVLLAQTLFGEPELLLLDEPTNHLDIASIRWLEAYLRAFRGAFVVISHDRHFLNSVCDSIADVDYQELRVYPGNYDAFEAAKALAMTQREAEISRTEQKIEEMQKFIDRFGSKATKARQANARKKQVEKMELPEIKRTSRKHPGFAFDQRRPSGREALSVKQVSKAYGETRVLQNVSLTVERGEHVAIVGPNGVGKSTLLRMIADVLERDEGTIDYGHEIQAGFFAQDHHEQLEGRETAYEWLCGAGGSSDIPTVRGMLGRVLFTGDEADKRVDDLSGGEAARLLLASLMMRKPNLMLLDEPTNHLDLEGREALANALAKYPGTLLFVSHDRTFVSTVGTRVLAISPEGVEDFGGGYEEYLRMTGADYLDAAAAQKDRRAAAKTAVTEPATYEDRKDSRRNLAALKRTVEKLEAEVGKLEKELAQLEASFAQPDYFMKAGRGQLEKDSMRRDQVQKRLAEAITEWEAGAAELEVVAPA
ncbi:MAG: ATP-binding cassette domain-containing protein [Chloroflexota bacterium]